MEYSSGKPKKSALPIYGTLLVFFAGIVALLVWAIQRPDRYVTLEAPPPDSAENATVDFGKKDSTVNAQLMGMNSNPEDGQFAGTVRSSPQSVEEHKTLAETLMQQGEHRKATLHFAEVLRQNPEDLGALKGLAQSLARSGKAFEAAEKLNELIAKTPDDAEAHLNLSEVLQKLGKTNEAQQEYERALRLNPDLKK